MLSRTKKYSELRNQLANDSEKAIATEQLKQYQEKLIGLEKNFGSSKTEKDFHVVSNEPNIDVNKYREIVNKPEYVEKAISDEEKAFIESKRLFENEMKQLQLEREQVQKELEAIKQQQEQIKLLNISPVVDEKEVTQNEKKQDEVIDENIEYKKPEVDPLLDIYKQLESYDKKETNELSIDDEENYIEKIKNLIQDDKEEQKAMEEYVSFDSATINKIKDDYSEKKEAEFEKKNDENIQTNITPILKQSNSLEAEENFKKICDNVNLLASEITMVDSVRNKEENKPERPVLPDANFELSNTKKEINELTEFIDNLNTEVENYNRKEDNKLIDEIVSELVDEQRHGEEKDLDFENTVSLAVDKINLEINSSKSDSLSAADIIDKNETFVEDLNKKSQEGKTIAFDVNSFDNSLTTKQVILTHPEEKDDNSITTMSFETKDIHEYEDEKGNKTINIVLGFLIVLAVLALGAIVYFFLLTRGII